MGRAKGKKGKKESRDPRQEHLDQLHMEFRKMEAKKKKNNEATQNNIRMQKQQIVKLELDNDRLKEDLALETRQARASSSMASSSQIDRLKDEADEFTRKIQLEKYKKKELVLKIKELEKELADQRAVMRKHMHGYSNSRDYNLRIQREIRRYESRLDKARIKYNEAKAHNNNLREQIDNLRHNRDSYDVIFKKLTKELQDKKKQVQELIESSNMAYKDRSGAQHEINELKLQADSEQRTFEVDWRKLGEEMKREQEADDDLDPKSGSRKYRTTAFEALAEDTKEEDLKREVEASGKNIAQNRAKIAVDERVREGFENAFNEIQKQTKISDIDDLVKVFITAEDRNFNLFNEVNDITADIEKQQLELEQLKRERDKYKEVGAGIEMDKTRKDMLTTLQKTQKKTADKASMMEKKYENSLKLIINMKNGIKEIFDMIGCDRLGSAKELIAEGLTETNMLDYLGIIEEQTNEILDAYQKAQDLDDDEDVEEDADEEEEEAEENKEGAKEETKEEKEGGDDDDEENFEVQTNEKAKEEKTAEEAPAAEEAAAEEKKEEQPAEEAKEESKE